MKHRFSWSILLLTILAGGSLLFASCQGQGTSSKPEGSSPSTSSVEEQEPIILTAEKTTLLVGETTKITSSVEGVSFESRDPSIATVDSEGNARALREGVVRITARKTGYKTGNITLTIEKAPEKPAKAIIDFEDAEHYSPTGRWGMSWGGTFMGPGDSPIEDNGGATEDGTSLGWLQAGCKETLTFTSNKAIEVEIAVVMAYNRDMDLETSIEVTFNDEIVSMAGLICPGGSTYYEFTPVSFGNVNLINGNNVLEITMIAQGPNIDCLKIYTEEDVTIRVVKPVVLPLINVDPESMVLTIGETANITTDAEDVTFTSENTDVVTVTNEGVVTAIGVGRTRIIVSKEGMRDNSVSVQVKAVINPSEDPKGVRFEFEDGEFSGPFGNNVETPIEENEAASGGKSIGNLIEGSIVAIEFNANKNGKADFYFSMASTEGVFNFSTWSFDIRDQLVSDAMDIKVNGKALNLEGIALPGNDESNWHNFHVFSIKNVDVKTGINIILLECKAQAPNCDFVQIDGLDGVMIS